MKKDNTITVFYDEVTQRDIYRLNGVDVTDTIEMLKDKWERQILDTRCRLFQLDMTVQQRLQEQLADLEAKLDKSEKERELDNSFWKQECDSLQKTLAEKEKIEYTDTISFVETSEPDIVAKELDRLNEQLAEKDKEIETILKENEELVIKHNVYNWGDKIQKDKVYSLTGEALELLINRQNQKAIEQLEKAKEKILSYEEIYYQFLESGAKVPVVCLENFRVRQTIDSQINGLKGEVQE